MWDRDTKPQTRRTEPFPFYKAIEYFVCQQSVLVGVVLSDTLGGKLQCALATRAVNSAKHIGGIKQ